MHTHKCKPEHNIWNEIYAPVHYMITLSISAAIVYSLAFLIWHSPIPSPQFNHQLPALIGIDLVNFCLVNLISPFHWGRLFFFFFFLVPQGSPVWVGFFFFLPQGSPVWNKEGKGKKKKHTHTPNLIVVSILDQTLFPPVKLSLNIWF